MLAHSLQFSFLLALGSNFVQHLIFGSEFRKGSHANRYGPLYLAIIGMVFLMIQPSLYVFKDVGCPVRCMLTKNNDVLRVTFLAGGLLLVASAAWSMNLQRRFTSQ